MQLNDQEMCQSNFTQSRYQRACKGKCKLMSSSQEICVLFVLYVWLIILHSTQCISQPALSTFVIIFTHRNILNQWYTKENIKKKEISRKHCLSSPRAESARAVTGRRNSHRWEGGRLFDGSAGFFYGNSCNSGTKSRKIISKVGN